MASLLWTRVCTRSLSSIPLRNIAARHSRTRFIASSSSGDGAKPKDTTPINTTKNATRTTPLSLDIDIVPEESAQSTLGRTGAKSSKNSLSSFEKRRRFMGRVALGAFGLGVVLGIFYMGRDWESEEVQGRSKVLA